MRVHHVNCGTMCPLGFAAMKVEPKLVCHVLVIETEAGLVLVDTGVGTADINDPSKLGGAFNAVARPKLDHNETALAHVERLGFSRGDVRHILPTHLDLDHAGGIADFPKAKVHLFKREHEAAMARATLPEQHRYMPHHWAHGVDWALYETGGERWFGFDCVRELAGLPPEILIVPTIGHTRGHSVVAIDDGNGFLVHAGDAYFHRNEMDPVRPRCPAALSMFQRVVAVDNTARVRNQERLRILKRDEKVRMFSAHDPVEAESYGVS